ncbi:MAG TPA: polyphosphate kinase 2 family protein [Vicinamibacterales bacterium]|nr:polyphosphate kinase 2 family protein [Vicinamibacterales bacterium]
MKKSILTSRFRVVPGTRVRLSRYDPTDIAPYASEEEARGLLKKATRRLYDLTEILYAQDRYALLLIFQAMDAAGKDSAIKHVMRGLDPKATQVYTFKAPSEEELDHDYMWRSLKVLPERGRIGVFNRSYYEEVLVVRVNPHLLERQHIPRERVTSRIWRERYEDIRDIERYLCRNGTIIRKFFLNVSKAEQRRRFLARLDDPAKNWKFSINDVKERLRWDEYMRAYEDALSATSTRHAPWYVIPADHKWFTRLAVARVVIETLESLDLHFPPLDHRKRRELAEARRRLRAT